MAEQAPADEGDVGKHGDGDIGEALLDIGIVTHDRPGDGFQAVAHEEVDTQTEGSQGQAGDVLVGLEGDRQGRKQQAAQGAGQEGNRDAHAETVGVAAADVAEDGAYRHDALNTQVQAAGLFYHNFAHGAVKQRNVIDHDVVNEGA